MEDLIHALQIFSKYMSNCRNPTYCSHDMLSICGGVEKDMVGNFILLI